MDWDVLDRLKVREDGKVVENEKVVQKKNMIIKL